MKIQKNIEKEKNLNHFLIKWISAKTLTLQPSFLESLQYNVQKIITVPNSAEQNLISLFSSRKILSNLCKT